MDINTLCDVDHARQLAELVRMFNHVVLIGISQSERKETMARSHKLFGKRAKITVSFAGGSGEESFSVPLCLVGNIAPIVQAHFRGGEITVERGDDIVRSTWNCSGRTFGDRLSAFVKDLSRTFGRSYTTGGCSICGHDAVLRRPQYRKVS